jgi:hypothetical protein
MVTVSDRPPLAALAGVMVFCAVLVGAILALAFSQSPQDYAQAEMVAQATAQALPRVVASMDEANRHEAESNRQAEAVWAQVSVGAQVLAGVITVVSAALVVAWGYAGVVMAGRVVITQAAMVRNLPVWADIGNGYKIIARDRPAGMLDTRTGAASSTLADGGADPARHDLSRVDVLARTAAEISRASGKSDPGDWIGAAIIPPPRPHRGEKQ